MNTEETLTYLRKAYKGKDSYNGLMYVHRWPNGAQPLIFPTKDEAAKFKRYLKEKNRTKE
jgi:hypothetical protein